MATLKTEINLLPGLLSTKQVRKVLKLCLETCPWFVPAFYGSGEPENPLEARNSPLDFLVARHKERERLSVASRSKQDHLSIHSMGETWSSAYFGSIVWWTRLKSSPKWRAAHVEQVATLMRLLDSPLALCGDTQDFTSKTEWWEPMPGGGMISRVTTVSYKYGLSGVYWRNFYGPMFVRLFGDRLASLPKEYARKLGDDLWLVQPYELPQMAGTPEAKARERAIIDHLGPECFYDHERRVDATRRPQVPPVPLEDPSIPPLPTWDEYHQHVIQETLTEYWDWAAREWEAAGVVYRKTARGYLLLASEATARAKAVMDWAYSNLENPLFFRRSPDDVAIALQAKNEGLAQPPSTDPRSELARIREALGPAAFDALLSLIPAMGDVEAALRSFAQDDPEARELLPRVRALRQLTELLSFVRRPGQA